MEPLIQLLVALLVLVILWVIIKIAAKEFGLPDSVITIVALILGLLFLVYVLRMFGVGFPKL